jgi:hypothetical protein
LPKDLQWTEQRDKIIEDKSIIIILPYIRESRESQLLSAKFVDAIPLGTKNTNKYRNVKISSKVPKTK